jgi:cytochrome c oxidase assembly factor CtaG
MSASTTKWGIGGAVAVVVVGGLLVFVEVTLPYDSPSRPALHTLVWSVLCLPVALVWQVIFKVFGIHGDQGMAFILPMFATTVLYLGCLGFGIGVLLRKAFRVP